MRAFHAMFGVTPLDSRGTRGSPSTSAHLHSVLMPRGAGTWLPTAVGDNSSLSSHVPHLIHPPNGHLTSILFFSEPQGDGKKKKKQTKNQQHNTKTRHLLEVEALKYNHLKMIIYFQKKFWNRLVRAFGTDSGKFPRQQPFMEQACIRMRVGCLPKP